MKIYIDDERPIPEGWVGVRTVREAIHTICDHAGEITHISFDWQMSKTMPGHNGVRILQYLISHHEASDPVIFHAPRENYTMHSSDHSMREIMNQMVDEAMGIKVQQPKQQPIAKISQTRRLMANKRRR